MPTANSLLLNETNGKAGSHSPKNSKNARQPGAQKSSRGQQWDQTYGADQLGTSLVVEPPLYKEVLEKSSCDPVVHEVVVDAATGAKVSGSSVNGASAATPSAAVTAFSNNPLQLDPKDYPSVTEVAEKSKEGQKQREVALHANNGAASWHYSSSPSSAFVSRVASIPAVAETMQLLTDSVDSVARRNGVARLAVNSTKHAAFIGVNLADKLATPVKPVIENVIQKFDGRAADLLEKSLNKYPIIGKPPSEISLRVRDTALSTANNTAHRVLAFRPASFVASFTAKTVLSVNRGVDTVLHKTHLQAPNTHNQLYATVDWFANGVLCFVNESQNRIRQPRTVAVA